MQAEKFSDYLKERFGITLPAHVALVGDNSLRAMNTELKEFKTTTPKGIPASRMKGKFPKPSTTFIQLFGNLATKNTIELPREDALAYMEGKEIPLPAKKTTASKKKPGTNAQPKGNSLETGYVILTHKKAVLGIGFFREKENKIENMLPKGRRIHITQG